MSIHFRRIGLCIVFLGISTLSLAQPSKPCNPKNDLWCITFTQPADTLLKERYADGTSSSVFHFPMIVTQNDSTAGNLTVAITDNIGDEPDLASRDDILVDRLTNSIKADTDSVGIPRQLTLMRIVLFHDIEQEKDEAFTITYSFKNDKDSVIWKDTLQFTIDNASPDGFTNAITQRLQQENVQTDIATLKIKPKHRTVNTYRYYDRKDSLKGKLFMGFIPGTRDLAKPADGQLTQGEKRKIDIVRIAIEDGVIKRIQVEMENGDIFANTKGPISLTNFYSRKWNENNYLVSINTEKPHFIHPWDLLDFRYQTAEKFYPFDNDSVMLSANNGYQHTLKHDSNLQYLVHAAVFSDIDRVSSGTNGILQTEVSAKFIINSQNFKRSWFVPFNYIKPYFHFSKLETNLDTASVNQDGKIDRLRLLQEVNQTVGMKLNLLRKNKFFDAYWDAGIEWNHSPNIILPDGTVDDIDQTNLYLEFGTQIHRSSNFGIELLTTGILHKVWNKETTIDEKRLNLILNPSGTVSWYPARKKDQKVFARFTSYFSTLQFEESFNKLQIGYQINVSKLFDSISN